VGNFAKCIIGSILILIFLTTCAVAGQAPDIPPQARLYVDLHMPYGCERVDTLLRQWVEHTYVPILTESGAFVGMLWGVLALDFEARFAGADYAVITMQGLLSFSRVGQEPVNTALADNLHINTETGVVLMGWEVSDISLPPLASLPPLPLPAVAFVELEKLDPYSEITLQPVFPEHRPMIALTFDDGPSRFTEQIMDVLAVHGGRVTFCVLGNRVEDWENTVHRMVEQGHEIMGHSWAHIDMTRQNRATVTASITNTSDIIRRVSGINPPRLFRPPYGAINSQVEQIAGELGYGILLWTIDPKDWRYQDADRIYRIIMDQAIDGSIVVLHDVFATTAQAMERVIPGLIARGFELVTVSELIAHHYGAIQPGETFRGVRPPRR